jgi:ABC-2 type transport system ATP-binding protein
LRRMPGVETAAVFGDALRVAGRDPVALRTTLGAPPQARLTWQQVPPRLDDVFIHMLNEQEKAS